MSKASEWMDQYDWAYSKVKKFDLEEEEGEKKDKRKKAAKKRQAKYQSKEDRDAIIEILGGKKAASHTLRKWGQGLLWFIDIVSLVTIVSDAQSSEVRKIYDRLKVMATDMAEYNCTYMFDADTFEEYADSIRSETLRSDTFRGYEDE